MIQQLVIFALCLILGIISRLWFIGLLKAEKKMGKPAAITLEFFSMGLLITAFALIIFFLNNGVFMPYMLLAVLIGFCLISIFI